LKLFIFIGLLIIISVILFLYKLRQKSKDVDNELSKIANDYSQTIPEKDRDNKSHHVDLEAILHQEYSDHVITIQEEKDFTYRFTKLYKEAIILKRRLEFLHISPSDNLKHFINDYGSLHKYVNSHNEAVLQERIKNNKSFFDHCLAYPLDQQQRRSIVSEAENCLVVSSAGSGKTSSIVGKVKYLIEKKNINPEHILLISYTNKAASELTQRIDVPGLRGYTFHKLALDLIGQITGQKPSICDNTDALFIRIYHELIKDISFKKAVLKYFFQYETPETDMEAQEDQKRQDLSEQKDNKIKALLPDMDGNPVYVKSEQEKKICFALSSLGVNFRYEEPYEYELNNEMHSQYKPDFSIYYEKEGVQQRVYLEHFGIDEHRMVPIWFAKDRNISYEEACKKYGDGITWKKEAHKKYGTTLITTSSADFYHTDIRLKIKAELEKVGVPISLKADEELYDMVVPKESKQEKAFIRLCVTFITLLKTNCKNIKTILEETHDERSEFIIKNIFLPIYERYEQALKQIQQIDFTDAILWATKLCKTNKPVSYEYIIVDEFQDISMDRYRFLLALRDGNPQAKLFCVGDDWQSIYRFSGSDAALFNNFARYFGPTEINKIETTYRFCEPVVSLSTQFILRNESQITKNVRPFNTQNKTELFFYAYNRYNYAQIIENIIASIPKDKSIFLLGRYSFDDYNLSSMYQSTKVGDKFYYLIGDRKIEFLTIHKSKGLEADYVIILQCNKDNYGFPSTISDDPILNLVLTESDKYPFGEERRLFYVAITRAKNKTMILYDQRYPSVFVEEFLHPEKINAQSYIKHPNANKKWTRKEESLLLTMYREGKSISYIAEKMGRSKSSIIMRLGKHGIG